LLVGFLKMTRMTLSDFFLSNYWDSEDIHEWNFTRDFSILMFQSFFLGLVISYLIICVFNNNGSPVIWLLGVCGILWAVKDGVPLLIEVRELVRGFYVSLPSYWIMKSLSLAIIFGALIGAYAGFHLPQYLKAHDWTHKIIVITGLLLAGGTLLWFAGATWTRAWLHWSNNDDFDRD
jgi:hypothetical protein